jgi:DNA-binding IclR family transcriptional regulator
LKSAINTSSVDKAFVLLEFLAASGRPASLQEVTEAVKLPKPTAYRLLRTLQDLGYVSRPAGSRNYLVGPRTARLASADPHGDLKAQARPLLRRLYEEFNETINLGVLSGTQVLYLDFVETTQPLRFIVTPGQNDPWFCTALGRAVATHLSGRAVEKLVAETRLQPFTPHTVKSKADLLRKIEKGRADGYTEEVEESVPGVCCLAVNLSPLGFPDAAISMAVPTQRLTPRRKSAILLAFKTFTAS